MITIKKVTRNFRTVPKQSADIYWHDQLFSKSLTTSVTPNSYYVLTVSDSKCLNIFECLLHCNHQLYRRFDQPADANISLHNTQLHWLYKTLRTLL
jgi:hypothetical protein